ncbi:YgjV family protein [Aliiroseovarius sp. KMU-50]|uniref:YgjV family protein n=1 Tax=Aliiroseovarius salicola TaxID=3009082 RepID=A0ABT4VZP6_9RHOB|nr:YgjV family protein [Aliiroseovarius sp. KMU-50]MDA5093729.1 YgjV family protein [Aliiroseovarius sp. KMU-50]
MTIITETILAPTAAQAFGFAGLAAQMVWPLFRKRKAMLSVQLSASCTYAASYVLMGQSTAAAVCLTGATQNVITMLAGDHKWLSRISYVFLLIAVTVGIMTYAGLPSILAVTASCLNMIGRMQSDVLRMRGVQLSASPFGATHDVIVGAWPALAGAVVAFSIAITAFRREWHHRHPQVARP